MRVHTPPTSDDHHTPLSLTLIQIIQVLLEDRSLIHSKESASCLVSQLELAVPPPPSTPTTPTTYEHIPGTHRPVKTRNASCAPQQSYTQIAKLHRSLYCIYSTQGCTQPDRWGGTQGRLEGRNVQFEPAANRQCSEPTCVDFNAARQHTCAASRRRADSCSPPPLRRQAVG